mmetsp:Transcript_15494/g.38706  ORF Transcript_15494/g.38706 Transcript_15494/m.38706 type:complete len:370 (+) Transcript_15494:505-1614(+)
MRLFEVGAIADLAILLPAPPEESCHSPFEPWVSYLQGEGFFDAERRRVVQLQQVQLEIPVEHHIEPQQVHARHRAIASHTTKVADQDRSQGRCCRPSQLRYSIVETTAVKLRELRLDLLQDRSQRALGGAALGVENSLNGLAPVLEVLAPLVQRVVGEVSHAPMHVPRIRLLVGLCAESCEALSAHEDPWRSLTGASRQADVEPQIELHASKQQRFVDVALHHGRLLPPGRHLDVQLPKPLHQENSVAVRAIFWLHDERATLRPKERPYSLRLLRQHPRVGDKVPFAGLAQVLAASRQASKVPLVAQVWETHVASNPTLRTQDGQSPDQVDGLCNTVDGGPASPLRRLLLLLLLLPLPPVEHMWHHELS